MSKSLAVIVGAGPVGRAMAKIFEQRGVAVRFVTRSGRSVDGVPTVAADARNASALVEAAAGATVLVNAVGLPYQQWEKELPAVQSTVLAAAEATGAVAVFVDNLYAYDATSLPLSEASVEKPATRKGELRRRLTEQWLEAHREGRIRGVAVRASDYFGPGATRSPNSHFGARFFPNFEAGKPVAFLGNPDASHSFTYLPDFARALVDVSLDSSAWGKVWIAPSLEPASARTVAQTFAQGAGKVIKVGALPSVMVRLLGWFNPLIREVYEMLYQFENDFTVDARAFESKFGWKATTLEVAVKETLAAHQRG